MPQHPSAPLEGLPSRKLQSQPVQVSHGGMDVILEKTTRKSCVINKVKHPFLWTDTYGKEHSKRGAGLGREKSLVVFFFFFKWD